MSIKDSREIINDLYTIQDLLRWATSNFSAAELWYGHGTDNPWDEAVYLILPTLFLPLNTPRYIYSVNLTIKERSLIIDRVVKRIQERIPVSYITNKAWFCGYEFYVDKRVLIPRSPISNLIKHGFDDILDYHPSRILDMCTGSGCIAIACAYSFPKAKIDAVDLSKDALEVAKINSYRHNMNHINFIYSDLFKDLKPENYDLIIANPPYVSFKEKNILPAEYRHEPEISLFAKHKGLDIINRIIIYASNYLSIKGVLICEVGENMPYIIKKYSNIPFKWIEFNNGGCIFVLKKHQMNNIGNIFS